MKRKKSFRLLRRLFKTVGADKVIYGYLLFFVLVAFILRLVDPGIDNIFRGMWYCFTAASTIGFGDIVVQTVIGRILTIILSIYSVAVIGIFTAVVTSFYMEFVRNKASDNVHEFLDELERLPELSKEELEELSERIKKFRS